MQHDNPIMQLRGVVKGFPNGTLALRGVDLDIEQGKVHGLLGANGAGKSTLIKILSGAYWATLGEIIWRGKPIKWDSPKAANDMGVATVHQHIPLVPTLSVLENIYLGNRGLWRLASSSRRDYEELCQRIGYRLDPDALVGNLSIGERQMVSIMTAVGTGADLIVMDEPTASLAAEERELVYATVRRLSKGENKAILFVSHFLDEVMALTDQVTVLRDGTAVLRANTADLDEDRIAEAIVGKQIVALERQAQGGSQQQARLACNCRTLPPRGGLARFRSTSPVARSSALPAFSVRVEVSFCTQSTGPITKRRELCSWTGRLSRETLVRP